MPPPTWPALDYETWPWRRGADAAMVSRRQLRMHRGPYEAAVVPCIASVHADLPADLLSDAEAAATAIARFDAELTSVLQPFLSQRFGVAQLLAPYG